MGTETVVFGDLAGAVIVYYTVRDGELVWTTASDPLRDYADAEPDLDLFALDVVLAGIAPYGGTAPFDGVEVVPPGYALRIGIEGHSVERWYTPSPRATFDETAHRLGNAVTDGVRRRALRVSMLTADMGGTDSAVLAALAGRFVDTLAFTYVDDEARGDLEHGQRVAASVPRLTQEFLRGDSSALFYEGLRTPAALPLTDLPTIISLSYFLELLSLCRAAQAGSTDHLFGVGGDETLSTGPETLSARLRAGRVVSATRGAFALACEDRGSVGSAMLGLLDSVSGSYSRSMRRAALAIGRNGVDPNRQLRTWELIDLVRPTFAAGWLTRAAAERLAQLTAHLAEVSQPWEDPAVARDLRGRWRTSLTLAGYRAAAREQGLTAHAPWTDTAVIVASHALPPWQREPRGQFKHLARVGLHGVVPAVVTERTSKDLLGINQTKQLGARRNADGVRAVVASSRLVDAGIFDRALVTDSVEGMIAGTVTADQPVSILLAAELWLAQPRRNWWMEARLWTQASSRTGARPARRSPRSTRTATSSSCRSAKASGWWASPRSPQCGTSLRAGWTSTPRSRTPPRAGSTRTGFERTFSGRFPSYCAPGSSAPLRRVQRHRG
jgi:asparagine synthase (glutamine-hydrolysing)